MITDADLDRAARERYLTDYPAQYRRELSAAWDAGAVSRDLTTREVRDVVAALEAAGLTVARLTPATRTDGAVLHLAGDDPAWQYDGLPAPGVPLYRVDGAEVRRG